MQSCDGTCVNPSEVILFHDSMKFLWVSGTYLTILQAAIQVFNAFLRKMECLVIIETERKSGIQNNQAKL
jgi:hypothetical protein